MNKCSKTALSFALTAILALAPVAQASAAVVYDATSSPLPSNVTSLGYQATSTSELGDKISLGGTERLLKSVDVTMSTWAQYANSSSDERYSANTTAWTHPITLNVYGTELDSDGQPSNLLATKTINATIPWRPAADPVNCPTKENAGYAFKYQSTPGAADTNCYNGLAFNISFDMSDVAVELPNQVIVGVAYSTQSYGLAPIGSDGPYNSLNVGIPASQTVSVGADLDTDVLYWDTVYTGYTAGLREDTNWLPNGTIAFKIHVQEDMAPTVPTNGMPNGSYKATNEFDFTWNESTDDKPGAITYQFQSSLNPAQSGGVLTTGIWSSGILTDNMIHSSGAPDGTWYWQVRAKDSAGHYSAWSQIWSMTIDSVAPSIPSGLNIVDSANKMIPDNGYTNSYTVTTSWNAVAGASFYEYSYWNAIPGNPYKEFSRYIATPVNGTSIAGAFNQGEGTHYVAVRAVDAAGNRSAWSTPYAVKYDKTPPAVPTLAYPLNNSVVNASSPIANSWSAVAGAVSYTYTSYNVDVNGNCIVSPTRFITTYTSNQTNLRTIEDGLSLCWDVSATDVAGNVSPVSERWKVTIDNTAPVATITSPFDGSFSHGLQAVRGSIADANLLRYHVQIENESGSVIYSQTTDRNTAFADELLHEWDTTLVPDGEYKVYLEARDQAGNKDGTRTAPANSVAVSAVTVDNTGPVVTLTGPTGTVAGVPVIPSVEASDIQKPLMYAWAAVNPANQSLISDASLAEPTITPTVAGTYDFVLTTRDPSGNETLKTLSFVWSEPVTPPVSVPPTNIPASARARVVASANAAFNRSNTTVEDEGDVLAATDEVTTGDDEEESVESVMLVDENGVDGSSGDPLFGTVVLWLALTIGAIGGLIFWVFKSRKHDSE